MSEKKEYIRIRGAREHNLKNINIDIPRNEFVVLTGLSGYDLCGGTEKIYGVTVFVCKTVLRTDGKAGR